MLRFPAPSTSKNEDYFGEVFFNEQFDKLPITSAHVKRETQREPILSRVHENVNKGWSPIRSAVAKPSTNGLVKRLKQAGKSCYDPVCSGQIMKSATFFTSPTPD